MKEPHLSKVDRSDLLVVQKLGAVDEDHTAEVPLLPPLCGGVRGAVWLCQANKDFDEQSSWVSLFAILRDAPEDYGGRQTRLDRSKLRRREELGRARVDERLPWVPVESLRTAMQRYGRGLVRLGRDYRSEPVTFYRERSDGETVRVAADDRVGVFLSNVTGRVFRSYQDVMGLNGFRSQQSVKSIS